MLEWCNKTFGCASVSITSFCHLLLRYLYLKTLVWSVLLLLSLYFLDTSDHFVLWKVEPYALSIDHKSTVMHVMLACHHVRWDVWWDAWLRYMAIQRSPHWNLIDCSLYQKNIGHASTLWFVRPMVWADIDSKRSPLGTSFKYFGIDLHVAEMVDRFFKVQLFVA